MTHLQHREFKVYINQRGYYSEKKLRIISRRILIVLEMEKFSIQQTDFLSSRERQLSKLVLMSAESLTYILKLCHLTEM